MSASKSSTTTAVKRQTSASGKPKPKRASTPKPKSATAAKPAAAKPKSTAGAKSTPKSTGTPKPKPTTASTTGGIGAAEHSEHQRTAQHATAIMRAGAPTSSRSPISTPQIAAVLAVTTPKSIGTTVAPVPKLAAYATGKDDADTSAAVRKYTRTLVGVPDGQSRAATGSQPKGLSKLGGRKLAALLVAVAAADGQTVPPAVRKLAPKS
jgi:hypothetical protein